MKQEFFMEDSIIQESKTLKQRYAYNLELAKFVHQLYNNKIPFLF